MIEICPGVFLFEPESNGFVKNHDELVFFGKGNTMQKLKHDHIAAVTRAQNLIETAIDVAGNQKLNTAIRNDIVLLCQLRMILYFALENPTLPFIVQDTVAKPIAVTGDEETQ